MIKPCLAEDVTISDLFLAEDKTILVNAKGTASCMPGEHPDAYIRSAREVLYDTLF